MRSIGCTPFAVVSTYASSITTVFGLIEYVAAGVEDEIVPPVVDPLYDAENDTDPLLDAVTVCKPLTTPVPATVICVPIVYTGVLGVA